MKRYMILTVMLFAALGGLFAQDTKESAPSFTPEAGDFSGAILLGRGNFLNSGLTVPQPVGYYGSSWYVSGQAPYNNTVDVNNNSISNIVGAEMRYFLTSNMALKLSGGAILRNTPAVSNIPGVADPNAPNSSYLPNYRAVPADNQTDINVNLGYEYHFATKYNRLSPYAGVTIPFYYGRRSQYDPTIDLYNNSNPDDPNFILDIGLRHGEQLGFGAQAVAGVDYYLMEGFYFGFEVKPISYVYARSTQFPAPGLPSWTGENTSFSFFSQTFLKIGFRF